MLKAVTYIIFCLVLGACNTPEVLLESPVDSALPMEATEDLGEDAFGSLTNLEIPNSKVKKHLEASWETIGPGFDPGCFFMNPVLTEDIYLNDCTGECCTFITEDNFAQRCQEEWCMHDKSCTWRPGLATFCREK